MKRESPCVCVFLFLFLPFFLFYAAKGKTNRAAKKGKKEEKRGKERKRKEIRGKKKRIRENEIKYFPLTIYLGLKV